MPMVKDPTRLRFRLPGRRRLRRRNDVAALIQARCSVADQRLVVYAGPGPEPGSRMAVSVSKRLGGAVARNRIKRLVREAFRLEQHQLPGGYDYLFVARPGGPVAPNQYRASLRALCLRAVSRVHRKRRGPRAEGE